VVEQKNWSGQDHVPQHVGLFQLLFLLLDHAVYLSD
jgi:hypothetical protein